MAGESKWADLPPELLITITKLCTTTVKSTSTLSRKLQLRRVAAVCNSWRSAISFLTHHQANQPPPPSPHDTPIPVLNCGYSSYHHLSDKNNDSNNDFSLYLVPTTAFIIRSTKVPSKPHLVVVDHLADNSGNVYSRHLRKPLSSDVNYPKSINLLDYHISVVAEEYCLRVLMKHDNGVLRFRECCRDLCKKAIIIWNPNSKDDGVAFVLFDRGQLAMYDLLEKEWRFIYQCRLWDSDMCSDVQKYEDCVVIIDQKANAFLLEYDFNARRVCWTKIARKIIGSQEPQDRRGRLVVDPEGGGLFLVQVGYVCKWSFEKKVAYVYSFCKQQQEWLKVEDVPGFILFVACDFAFTMDKEAFPGVCRGDFVRACHYKRTFPLYRDNFEMVGEICFEEIEYGMAILQFRKDCAGGICNMPWDGFDDYCSISDSPNECLDSNAPPPSSVPQHLPVEHKQDAEVEPKIDNRAGVYGTGSVKPGLDVNVRPDHSSPDTKEVLKENGKRRTDEPGHVESTHCTRHLKSRRIIQG